jgi:hypothetical protein
LRILQTDKMVVPMARDVVLFIRVILPWHYQTLPHRSRQ